MVKIVKKLLSLKELKRCTFILHPNAKPAFDFFFNHTHLFCRSRLNASTLQVLNQNQTFYGIRTQENEIALFSGYEFIGFDLANIEFTQHNVIIFSSLTDEEIIQQAWVAALYVVLTSPPTKHLEELRRVINNLVPTDYINLVFKKIKISQRTWSEFNGVSRDGLAKQSQSTNKPTDLQISIFERLENEYAG
ncbi:hypothetical protein VAS14_15952 [Vibrio angustum S14]|uniref:Uncharacterized protein n=1 Tax=Photobacterium angustum (strain S14 / CCUG 15956) TaxID=314292 RepID=Q1ZMF0_PHOAS|nr:hypothetical protein VAS14_15952 [Vibrio angustum S14] [Photobacterium angustum S14]